MIEYKVLNLTLIQNDYFELEALLAELSEIESIVIRGNSFTPTHFKALGKLFVFFPNSFIAKKLISSPEEIIKLNLKDFKIEKINLYDGIKLAYFHFEYLKAKQDLIEHNKVFNEISFIDNSIEECLLTHHTDMYFTFIFRYIIYSEYENEGNRLNIDLYDVFEKYKKLCAYVLMESCSVQTPDYNLLKNDDFTLYYKIYSQLLEHGKLYSNVIADYVICRKQVKEIILSELNDTEHFYPIFIQHCMMKGYEYELRRIENNLNNEEYFNHELTETTESKVIKIFPTPYGFLNKEILVKMVNSGEIDEALDSYLKKYGIERIINDELNKELNTKYIYHIKNENGFYYYKRRTQNNEYAPFGEQDRKDPIRSLIVQGQINLTKKK